MRAGSRPVRGRLSFGTLRIGRLGWRARICRRSREEKRVYLACNARASRHFCSWPVRLLFFSWKISQRTYLEANKSQPTSPGKNYQPSLIPSGPAKKKTPRDKRTCLIPPLLQQKKPYDLHGQSFFPAAHAPVPVSGPSRIFARRLPF